MHRQTDKKWSGKSRGGRWGYLFFVYTIRLLGIKCAYAFLALILLHFIPFAPKAARSVWDYNRKRLKYGYLKSIVKLYQHYYVFGQTLIDKIAIKSGLSDKYRFEFDHYDRFLEIMNGNQGVVLIGAHIGCWEAGASFFGQYGKKINIVMFDVEHQQIKEVIDKHAEAQNFKIIPINKGSLEAILDIKLALNNNEYVCFNGDRFLDKETAMELDFLGSKALFPIGPFKIANKCKVPVIFYYSMREKGCKYRFIFQEAAIDKQTNEVNLMTQYVTSLESILKQYPQQWFNFYRFWNN